MSANPIRPGLHTITPNIVVQDCAAAMTFYTTAFGAEELARFPMPDGTTIMHAEMRIGDSIFFLNDEFPAMESFSPLHYKGTSCSLMLAVVDCDAAFARAVEAGCTVDMPPADMFWGDRFAAVTDPFGHSWGISTHIKDMTMEEMRDAAQAAFAEGGMHG